MTSLHAHSQNPFQRRVSPSQPSSFSVLSIQIGCPPVDRHSSHPRASHLPPSHPSASLRICFSLFTRKYCWPQHLIRPKKAWRNHLSQASGKGKLYSNVPTMNLPRMPVVVQASSLSKHLCATCSRENLLLLSACIVVGAISGSHEGALAK